MVTMIEYLWIAAILAIVGFVVAANLAGLIGKILAASRRR